MPDSPSIPTSARSPSPARPRSASSSARAAADNVKKVTLELGGKGANIVLPDADFDLAVDGSLFAFLLMSGQACESGTRLLVHESIHDEFVARLVARAETLVMGDPMSPATDLGPLVSAKQKARVEKYIALGQEEGCKIAFQGTVPSDPALAEGHWVPPTILTGANNQMRIAREEIFGPVLVVIPFRDDDEAVAIANDSEYGLSAGCGAPTTAVPSRSHDAWSRAPCGSTTGTWSTRCTRSAVSSRADSDANWGPTRSTSTPSRSSSTST